MLMDLVVWWLVVFPRLYNDPLSTGFYCNLVVVASDIVRFFSFK